MSYFIRVLCASSAPLERREIENFVRDGSFFDREPTFSSPAADASSASESELIEVHYDPAKRPVRFSSTTNGELFREELDEIRQVTADLPPEKREFIVKHLQRTRRIFAIELDPSKISDEAWEMLDSVEAFIASCCDGIVFAPDDGFYDATLQLVAKVKTT